MYKAYIQIQIECEGETADEAERHVIEECYFNIEIQEIDDDDT